MRKVRFNKGRKLLITMRRKRKGLARMALFGVSTDRALHAKRFNRGRVKAAILAGVALRQLDSVFPRM